jgi:hypothetical protein
LAPRPVDAVVVYLAHGGSAVDADLWTGLLDRFPEAFHLGLADPDLPAGSPILDRFGPAVYRYSHQHAQAEGWLPAAAGAPKAELSAPDELIFELEEVFEAVPAGRF